MNRILVTALTTVLAAPLCAQQTPPPAVPPTPPPAAEEPAKPAAAPVDPAQLKAAEQLLGEVVKAYKSAPTLTDTVSMDIQSPMGPQQQQLGIIIGKGTDAQLTVPGMIMTSLDGHLYLEREDAKKKYLKVPLEGDLKQTLQKVFGGGELPFQFEFRQEAAPDAPLKLITFGMLEEPAISGHEVIKDEAGKDVHVIKVGSARGSGSVHINPESKFITGFKTEFVPPGAPEGFTVKADVKFSPEAREALPTALAFDPGERKAVSSMDDLAYAGIEVGAAMPEFTLQTAGGETVTLGSLTGNVVVLDFWATWCGPCKRGLPSVQEFATWAHSSGQKIKVYAVNVWEREQTPEACKAKAEEYWKAQSFTLPLLLDVDNKLVTELGFTSIPTTIIIDAQGKVFKVHSGFDPNSNLVETLKAEVAKAAEVKG